MRKIIFISFLLLTSGCSIAEPLPSSPKKITSYKECVEAGNRILKSLPAKCLTPEGETFVDDSALKFPVKQGASLCRDLCGDGVCQEIVCFGEGCPCAETHVKCPKDC